MGKAKRIRKTRMRINRKRAEQRKFDIWLEFQLAPIRKIIPVIHEMSQTQNIINVLLNPESLLDYIEAMR